MNIVNNSRSDTQTTKWKIRTFEKTTASTAYHIYVRIEWMHNVLYFIFFLFSNRKKWSDLVVVRFSLYSMRDYFLRFCFVWFSFWFCLHECSLCRYLNRFNKKKWSDYVALRVWSQVTFTLFAQHDCKMFECMCGFWFLLFHFRFSVFVLFWPVRCCSFLFFLDLHVCRFRNNHPHATHHRKG